MKRLARILARLARIFHRRDRTLEPFALGSRGTPASFFHRHSPRPPRFHPIGGLVFVVVSSLVVPRASAHEPFDISSRIVVHADRIELTSTLGLDGVRQLLAAAGVSPEKIKQAVQARGPDDAVEHPSDVARLFFVLAVDSDPLAPAKVVTVSEGMEVILTVVYVRREGRSMSIHAACYETVPELRRGVLQVLDDTEGKLGAALFSPKNMHLTVPLKASPPAPKPAG